MTPERIEEKKLKKGDRVVMHTCIESEEEPGKIWTCKTDQFTRGKGVFAQDSVFLEGYSGSFAPEFLQKVALHSEDERVLAALEESQQQTEDFKSQRDHYRSECRKLNLLVKEQQEAIQNLRVTGNKVEYELAEAQQTIARQQEAMDRASDMMNHKHPAYQLLQDALLPAGEGSDKS